MYLELQNGLWEPALFTLLATCEWHVCHVHFKFLFTVYRNVQAIVGGDGEVLYEVS